LTASVAIDERPEGLLKMSQADEVRIVDFLDYRTSTSSSGSRRPPRQRSRSSFWMKISCWQDKLDFLHEQMRQGGLKEQYYPKSPISSGPNVLQLDMLQNTLPSFGGPAPAVPSTTP